MKVKREIAIEIFNKLEDEDLVNFHARNTPDETFADIVDVVSAVLSEYIVISGQIIE